MHDPSPQRAYFQARETQFTHKTSGTKIQIEMNSVCVLQMKGVEEFHRGRDGLRSEKLGECSRS